MPDELRAPPGAPAEPARWRTVSDIVDAALELPREAREAFVTRASPNADLRAEVHRLLRACDRSSGFLDGAASAFAAPLLGDDPDPGARDDATSLTRLRQSLAGRYVIEGELGRGGMAIVYRARDQKRDREVAVKLLRPQLAAALGAERFLREIETAARLTHPNILPVLESGDADGLLYFVMPYIGGETLRDRLDRERQLPQAEATRIARDVADALDHAHRSDVLHRDLKPENVLLANGRAFLADFGIACAISRATDRTSKAAQAPPLTGAGFSLGTPAYMSPEQAFGSRLLDGRSDIYALGCLLYEMLAGDPPFTGPAAHVVRQHATGPVPNVSAVRDDLGPGLASAVARALSKAPDERFATMREFAQALSAPAGDAAARVSSPAHTPRRLVSKTMLGLTILASIAILVLTIVALRG